MKFSRSMKWCAKSGSKLIGRLRSGRANSLRLAKRSGMIETLEPRTVLNGLAVLSEFMAINDRTLRDEDGDFSDWIEIHNPAAEAINLEGWYLTDNASNLTNWKLPSVELAAGENLIVFASNKDRALPDSEFHTDFKLSGSGEYLALVEPDGVTIATEFDTFPRQVADVSFGLSAQGLPRYFGSPSPGSANGTGSSDLGPIIGDAQHDFVAPPGAIVSPLVQAGDTADFLVPSSNVISQNWTDPDYQPGTLGETWSSVTTGVGFEDDGQFADSISTDVGSQLQGVNSSAILRSTFNVDDPSVLDELTLRVKYDDGFVAYLNGEQIASRNAPVITAETGLVSFYEFNGNTDDSAAEFAESAGRTQDDLTGGFGSPRFAQIAGRQAVALDAEAGDALHLSAPNSQDTLLSPIYSIEAWIYPTELDNWGRLVLNWSAAGQSYHFAIRNGSQVSLFHKQSDGATVNIDSNPGFVQLGSSSGWQHIAGIADSENLRIYFNGRLVGTQPYDGTINSVAQGLGIGDNPEGGGSGALRFQGYVDDVAIWNRALSGADVLSHFLAGTDGYGLSAQDSLAFDAAATSERPDELASQFEEIDVSQFRDALRSGENVLTIQGLNVDAADDDFLLVPELFGATGSETAQPLRVTARVEASLEPIDTVTLHYRVMFENEQTLPMFDDGQHGDGEAGDGIFGANISGGVAAPGEMLRYYITATDTVQNDSRFPIFGNPRTTEEYFGTVIEDPRVVSQLPILHRFIEFASRAESRTGTRGSVFYNGEFYDNVFIRMRGQTSASWPKKSYKIDFNPGHSFLVAEGIPRKEEININTTYTDKSYIRGVLAYQIFRDTGSPYSLAFPLRMQQNGSFFSVAQFVEQVDTDYLRRNGLDDEGALYKPNGNNLTGSATSGVTKKNRRDEDFSDLQAFIDGIGQNGRGLQSFLFDNVNIPAQINYMVANIINQNIDRTVKNYYIYRDTNGTGEWQMLPWDVDLTFGPDALNTNVIKADFDSGPDHSSHPFLGGLEFSFRGLWNKFLDVMYKNSTIQEMFLRRLRTAMDEQLQAPGTPTGDLKFEARLDELVAQMAPDVALDRARWGNAAHFGGTTLSFQQEVDRIRNEYFPIRREHLFFDHRLTVESDASNLLNLDAAATALVPTESLGLNWTATDFDDSAWIAGINGVGIDSASTFRNAININLNSTEIPAAMRMDTDGDGVNENDSVYVRLPFQVEDLAAINSLTLRMKFDDGFVAYLNGTEVAKFNAPNSPVWNSPSTSAHNDALALQFTDFNISQFVGELRTGENVLAIHGLNDDRLGSGSSSDMLIAAELSILPPAASNSVGIPGIQRGDPTINFGEIDFNPVSGNQDEEFIELINRNDTAVDISGWKLTGGVEHTFQPGVVIPAGGRLYVSPNAKVFRARASGPSGGQSLFVQGGYRGHISNFGETIELIAPSETIVATINTPVAPSAAQASLRISEIHYNPTGEDLTEFIELTNIGDTPLDLEGVQFSRGVQFTFGPQQTLEPGQHILVVQDSAAMIAKYGSDLNIAGEFQADSRLENSGETIKLEDANFGTILEFKYEDGKDEDEQDWHPTTDAGGHSLVIVDVAGDRANWDVGSGWRPSFQEGGSPSESDVPISDIDGDNHVGLADLILLQHEMTAAANPDLDLADLDGNGQIDAADFRLLAGEYGLGFDPPQPAPAASVAIKSLDTIATIDLVHADKSIPQSRLEETATSASRRMQTAQLRSEMDAGNANVATTRTARTRLSWLRAQRREMPDTENFDPLKR